MSNSLDDVRPGDGVSWTVHSDTRACTVVSRTRTRITVQADRAVLLNGPTSGEPDALQVAPGGFAAHVEGRQRYRFERDPEGRIATFTRRTLKSGRVVWKLVGHRTRSPGNVLHPGRFHFHDYNF